MQGSATTAGAGRSSRWRWAGWGAAALVLLLPLLAMRFTDEVDWGAADFAFAGALLALAGGALELAARTTADKAYRAASGVAVATAFLLVWVNAAVGIIGSEDNPANLLYFGVPAVGVIGAAVARGQPRGMARALAATALAHALVGLVAGLAGWGNPLAGTLVFVPLWLASAWLFRRAARAQRAA